MAQIREIAEQKMPDLNANDIDAAAQMIRARRARWASKWWSSAMAKRKAAEASL